MAPAPLLVLTMGSPSTLRAGREGVVDDLDLYDLDRIDLACVRGLLVGAHADQRFLSSRHALLDAFVASGRRLVVCGQVAVPFGAGLTPFVPLDHHGVDDLTVHRLADHPVWEGVDPRDLTFRRGVAGFYGRGSYPDLPDGARVVHGLGPAALPLDAVYAWGRGEVLVDGGNDLWGYGEEPTSAARMAPQLVAWLLRDGPS